MGMWGNCKKILCIRADNMGDLIMTTPALRALKETFHCHITVLTSSMGKGITPFIPFIDDTIVFDAPWIKSALPTDFSSLSPLIETLRQGQFDAAVIFTVYSQSALPAAMMTAMAGIPRRLAYCRENPYGLLTDWVPDKEPYEYILHQVERDLRLAGAIGALTRNDRLFINCPDANVDAAQNKLFKRGILSDEPFLIFHPGVSEEKRKYPVAHWIELGREITKLFNIRIFITGIQNEYSLAQTICEGIGSNALNVAGLLNLGEFIALADKSLLVVTVNTSTVHIAAARQTPVVVLYAMTNPQHTPWKVENKVFYFSVAGTLKSKNEIVAHVDRTIYNKPVEMPPPAIITPAIKQLLEHIMHNTTPALSGAAPGPRNDAAPQH